MKKSFTLLCLLFAILGNTLADETNSVGALSAGPWKLLKDAPSKAKITFQAHDSLQTAVQFSLTLPDGVAISKDENGEYACSLTGDYRSWEDIGMGYYREALVSDWYSSLENLTYQVPIQRCVGMPGVYRLVNPYGEYYPYNYEGDYDATMDSYLVIDASDPDYVWVETINTNMDWGYGYFTFPSYISYMLSNGYDLEELKSNNDYRSYFGTIKDGIITMPARSFCASLPKYQGGRTYGGFNRTGLFAVALPGYHIPDYSVNYSYTACVTDVDGQDYVSGWASFGEDVAKAVAGLATDATIDSVLTELEAGNGLDIANAVEFRLPFNESGQYYVIIVPFDAEGNIHPYSSTQVKAVTAKDKEDHTVWVAQYTGSYCYGLFSDPDSGDLDIQEGLTLYVDADNAQHMKIAPWMDDSHSLQFYMNEDGTLTVPEQATGFNYNGELYVQDVTSFTGGDEDYAAYVSKYKDNVFTFNLVYYNNSFSSIAEDTYTLTGSSEAKRFHRARIQTTEELPVPQRSLKAKNKKRLLTPKDSESAIKFKSPIKKAASSNDGAPVLTVVQDAPNHYNFVCYSTTNARMPVDEDMNIVMMLEASIRGGCSATIDNIVVSDIDGNKQKLEDKTVDIFVEHAYSDDQGIIYTLFNGKNEYAVTGYTNDLKSDVVIASEVDGMPVTSIDTDALEYSALHSVVVPSSIKSIGYCSFFNNPDLTTVTIEEGLESIGDFAFQQCFNLESINLPNSLKTIRWYAFSICPKLTSITVPEGITEIEEHVFWADSSLVSVTLPETLTKIGYGSFHSCTSLPSIEIPNSVEVIDTAAFWRCESLSSIYIPYQVSTIGQAAFGSYGLNSIVVDSNNTSFDSRGNCNAIIEKATNTLRLGCKNTNIPTDVTSIGDYAFYYCRELPAVALPQGLTSIGKYAFYVCTGLTSVEIPDGVTNIGDYAFAHCQNITSISVPESVTDIGEGAFEVCSSLSSFTIPQGVTIIRDYTFTQCESLTSINIPENVTKIGHAAIANCYSLPAITIPNKVDSIGEMAFYACRSLKSIAIPKSVTSIGGLAFAWCADMSTMTVDAANPVYDSRNDCNAIIETATNTLVSGCQNTVIPQGITSIGRDAFHGSQKLASIDIPQGVTSIGDFAFRVCESLTSVSLPEGVTSIGYAAFAGCYALKSVSLPSTSTTIGEDAFSSCDNLASVIVLREQPIALSDNTFYSYNDTVYNNATLFVPIGCKDAYADAEGWKLFKNIVEMDTMGDVNIDGSIDVADVVMTVNDIAGRAQQRFYRALADVNGDSDVNVADVVGIVALITGTEYEPSYAPRRNGELTDELTATYDGKQLNLDLRGNGTYTACQMTVSLPEGANINNVRMCESRKAGHMLVKERLADGRYIIIAYSMLNTAFAGGDGTLLQLDLADAQDITIDDIVFATTKGGIRRFPAIQIGDATGINGLTPDSSLVEREEAGVVYDLSGRKVNHQLPQGIYIRNGKKIVVK